MASVTNTYQASFTAAVYSAPSRGSVNQTFANIRSGAGTTLDANTMFADLSASTTTNQFANLGRGIMTFNTASIGSDATITSAYIVANGALKANTIGSPTLEIVGATPASNTSIVAADYSQLGTTSFCSTSYASFNASGQNTFTLNSSGISNISLTGYSDFGVRTGWDQSGTFGGSWVSSGYSGFTFASVSPVLYVTYTKTFPTLSINNISSLANITTITTS